MANEFNTLYLQKYGSGAAMVDTLSIFGIHTGEDISPFMPSEVKTDGNAQDWPDESGLDVYNADVVNYKAYDIEVPIVITGDNPVECRDKGAALSAYLTGHDNGRYGTGTLFKIWHPWHETGAAGVRFKSTKDNKFNRDSLGNVFMTRTLVLECTEPDKQIKMNDKTNQLEEIRYEDTSVEI